MVEKGTAPVMAACALSFNSLISTLFNSPSINNTRPLFNSILFLLNNALISKVPFLPSLVCNFLFSLSFGSDEPFTISGVEAPRNSLESIEAAPLSSIFEEGGEEKGGLEISVSLVLIFTYTGFLFLFFFFFFKDTQLAKSSNHDDNDGFAF